MSCCPVVELRQYTLRPETRDALVDLFETNLLESQEELDMTVLGIFRELDNPDAFVWLRGFPDMVTRTASLTAFYQGPVWEKTRNAVNDTIVNSDNVLLLRPARQGSDFVVNGSPAPSRDGGVVGDRGAIEIIVCSFGSAAAAERALARSDSELVLAFAAAGGAVLAYFLTEESENAYPALPIRENEHVLLVVVGYNDRAAYEAGSPAIAGARKAFVRMTEIPSPPEIIRLVPTSRSRLTGSSEPCLSARDALTGRARET